MARLLYPMTAEWDPDARAWSLLSPDFPEIASVALGLDDLPKQAADALRTAIEARQQDGKALPPGALSLRWCYGSVDTKLERAERRFQLWKAMLMVASVMQSFVIAGALVALVRILPR